MPRSPRPATRPGRRTPAVWVSCGHAVYLGPSLALEPHSTAVDALAVAVDGLLTLRHRDLGEQTARSVLIPARAPHHIESTGDLMLFAYLDPGSARARECRGRMTHVRSGFGFDHADETELIELCGAASPDPARLLAVIAGPTAGDIDPRIAAVVDRIRADPGLPSSAVEIARGVGLSRSYFLHLFTAQTGTSFRRYRLWARMLAVVQQLSVGADLTTAACAAGYASPSHFSSSFKTMFGLTATALLSTGATIGLLDEPGPNGRSG
ncbi:helix-turn-helix domain-containing protein [Mycolicibacter minnesotensis]